MPRKVSYGVDFDDDYEDYDYDYADDYDIEVEGSGIVPQTTRKQDIAKTDVWRCPICTFDNEESMPACEICGVFRNPLVKINTNSDTALATFKLNPPSPDDLVSNGLQSLKVNSGDSVSTLKGKTISVETERKKHSEVYDKEYAPKRGNKLKIFDSTMNTISSSSRSGKTETINEGKVASVSEYKPETWMIPDEEDEELRQLNLAIVGHVDSGKSTLSGRLLHLLGQISQKEMHKNEKEAKQQGKGSFAYAWALDESAEERERGITMTVAVAFLTSRKYHVVLLDSPGHRDFVPNMISGATQADAAILVVDASVGSFEVGIDATGGQTREHAQLIRSFGVDQLIVAVNKMDVVAYSEERFDVIKQKLGTVLRAFGFKDSSVVWIPISAFDNQNLVANPSDLRLAWYQGPSLLDAIDSLQLPSRDYSKPPIMPICDVIKLQSQGQVSVCGKLESGAIRTGTKVLVLPSRETATVRSLERDSQVCNIAKAGDNVTVSLQGIEVNRLAAGDVICHPDFPVQVSERLQLKILVLDISTPILIGSQVVLQSPVCAEEYNNNRALGRVSLRALGRTVALGVVTKII